MRNSISFLMFSLFAAVFLFAPFLLTAQPHNAAVSDSTSVWFSLPSSFDFSSITAATATITAVLMAIWAVITGYFSSKWAWVTKAVSVLNTPARRVGAFGFLSSFVVSLAFGFSKDAQTALFAAFLALIGTFTGMGFYDFFLKKSKK